MKKTITMILAMLCGIAANAQQYAIGDYYSDDTGVKGIVIKVDDSGKHGLIMSLDRFDGKWTIDKNSKFATSAFYEDDGQKNMDAIEKYIVESGGSWESFPFFNWCRNKGAGWYPPALDEVKDLITAVNGSIGSYVNTNYYKFEHIITSNGGESLFGKTKLPNGDKLPYHFYVSTEGSKGKMFLAGVVQTSPFAAPKIMIAETKKTWSRYIGARAVHKF